MDKRCAHFTHTFVPKRIVIFNHSAMRKIALFALLAGIILAAAAYITEMNDLPGAVELRTPGFIGYIFIISAIAWFSVHVLYEWGKEADPYHH